MEKLTPKQKAFCDYYLQSYNATEAASKAGYSPKTASAMGYENLKKSYIKDYIQHRLQEIENERKNSGVIQIESGIVNKLLEMFAYDYMVLKRNIELTLIKTYLVDELSDEEIQNLNRRKSISTTTRYAVLKRANFKCQCCGEGPKKNNEVVLHIDHIIPFSLGGKDTLNNLQVLCGECNRSKNNFHSDNLNLNWE